VSRRRRDASSAAKLEQLPTAPPASEDRPVPVATFTRTKLPPVEARVAWERLVAALRRAVSER
jgi:hypothetical protein